ncbi:MULTISPECIES: hypothetical protein [Planktothricoides]|uniref:Uncharacterized protein n=2 Tax=Planktothricoides raciborskii TaxID=132608 RepID=A0AAU8J869_9CYAN|nr:MULTISPECIES: hypothetical protein [Planktothricoides]MBD2544961.1 hypothetical protein [Planktothricoides raciborskii FACHB-1370]MBD2584736.1 hypothetical protein [Planktothricoides raciborskii FACHB-1261]
MGKQPQTLCHKLNCDIASATRSRYCIRNAPSDRLLGVLVVDSSKIRNTLGYIKIMAISS